jgi:predicted TIM-barrel fold metal-dependent hydrolase
MVFAETASTGIVDCHFHVVAAPARLPMAAGRSYTPGEASLQRWRETLGPLGVTHGVVVQPSFYGTDNRALLAALGEGGGSLVGIAAVDANVDDDALDALAAAGVRGVRMAHFEAGDPRAMGGFVPFAAFDALEDRLHRRSMHLQLVTDSRLLPAIAPRLRRARVPVVIDHMGRSPARLGVRHAGIQSLVQLLSEGSIWVKLSGIANISDSAPAYDDVRPLHEALLAANPQRLVWGSDWPHTKPGGAVPDTAALLERFEAWTPPHERERILRRNPMQLYRFS